MQYIRAVALSALLAATAVHAQDTTAAASTDDLPDLSTATQATNTDGTSTSTSTSDATTSTSTGGATTSTTGATTSATGTTRASDLTTVTASGSTSVFHLSGLPTIEGAGIPTLVIPYTADAPFMQKSSLPEGTVFIAVGAVLAFLGACVLLWRGLVAWSVNRSVKRTAHLSEKGSTWGGASSMGGKSTYYKEYEAGSSMSLDALTSAGKPIRNSTFHNDDKRASAAPPAGLFFSPTAQTSNRVSSAMDTRASTYLPAGYYASPSAEIAGGRNSTVLGGHNNGSHASLAPYARHSTVDPSPPGSAGRPYSRSTSNYFGNAPGSRANSRDGLRRPSREGLRSVSRDGYGPSRDSGLRAPSRDGYGNQRTSGYNYPPPAASSLAAGRSPSTEQLAGQRAPSALLDDLFENHGHGPRERF